MLKSMRFGAHSTADKVLAGIDLTGKRILVTGCNSGIGYETMKSLAANGAEVIGLARSIAAATDACGTVGTYCTPVACDLSDLDSVASAADAIRARFESLDAIITNAGIATPVTLATRYGVELQFLVNHIGHFALVNSLSGLVRDGSGRIVIVSSGASVKQAPPEGIMFDNLDGRRFYDPLTFYAQSKLATALFAKELSRRLKPRGIAVNSVNPGATKGTRLNRSLRWPLRMLREAFGLFRRGAPRAAATQALLAASPDVAGITGEYWSNCQIVDGHPLLQDPRLADHLWHVSEQIVAQHTAVSSDLFERAA